MAPQSFFSAPSSVGPLNRPQTAQMPASCSLRTVPHVETAQNGRFFAALAMATLPILFSVNMSKSPCPRYLDMMQRRRAHHKRKRVGGGEISARDRGRFVDGSGRDAAAVHDGMRQWGRPCRPLGPRWCVCVIFGGCGGARYWVCIGNTRIRVPVYISYGPVNGHTMHERRHGKHMSLAGAIDAKHNWRYIFRLTGRQ